MLINKKAKIATEILLMMVLVVITSAVVLILVQYGIITVKADVSTEPVLNTEFIPLGRSGYLAIKEFQFCNFVDENFNCFSEQNEFLRIEDVYVRFVVESSVYNGEVMLVRNYRVKDPLGNVILELDQRNNYDFEMKSSKKAEPIVFADYFILGGNAPLGEYTMEIIVENTLLDKKVVLTKKFDVVEMEFFGE
ncbi:MAG: hypothetical protein ABH824_04945 [Nanoarchaeota archaeon]|nr:hypothetical protein [Nanoarchaeota archaeon]MBU1875832.1 hypothetical protein [Nanoarchaeota archaeon]